MQWLLLRIKLYYILLGNLPIKNLNPIETSQSICFTNKVTGFYITQALTKRYLQTDYNETYQGIKKEKENSNWKPPPGLDLFLSQLEK